jgi:hypothetical protein
MKPKLRTYNLFKAGVRREEYLSWEITDEQRVLYARFRSGSHQLRIERGRWENEVEAERLCMVCGTGKIENEKRMFRSRSNMYRRIRQETGYDLVSMKESEDPNWLLQALLGNALPGRDIRHCVGKAVAAFIAVAMRKRTRSLQSEKE